MIHQLKINQLILTRDKHCGELSGLSSTDLKTSIH
jgi:hypothetical protein